LGAEVAGLVFRTGALGQALRNDEANQPDLGVAAWGYTVPQIPGFEPGYGRSSQLGPKFVVKKQQCGRTAFGKLKTPKKAAVASVFCFTHGDLNITVMPRD
jgi:hypothetical protein